VPRALAFVRDVPSSFARAIAATPAAIDVARAREQHAAYVDGLRWLGYGIETIPADDTLPDSCFVEDTAVVAAGVALITRPGAASRRPEVAAVTTALAAQTHLRVVRMEAPATLDGGDVLRLGDRFYVGRSARTNDAGIAALFEAFAPARFDVIALDSIDHLHLKCVCSPLAPDIVLVAAGAFPRGTFGEVRVVQAAEGEPYASNAVARIERALVAAGHPGTRDALERAGFTVRELDTSEIRKADGALTCLSIRLD
jgi:dimethylargininase